MNIISVKPHNLGWKVVIISILQISKQIQLRSEMTGFNIPRPRARIRFRSVFSYLNAFPSIPKLSHQLCLGCRATQQCVRVGL